MMFPAQVETVGEGLMRECREEARTRGIIWQTHCAQSVPEFREMVARTGRTSVQWLADIGALDDASILGHAIYLDHHSSLAWHSRDDLGVLADSGAAIAHCPLTFSRWGTVLETFLTYRDAGVRIAMGNDTGPVNMLEEIRCAFTQARVASSDPASISMSEVFRAATIGAPMLSVEPTSVESQWEPKPISCSSTSRIRECKATPIRYERWCSWLPIGRCVTSTSMVGSCTPTATPPPTTRTPPLPR